ncbi:hypothetical protein BD560DRAFT_414660 [Blakeslea trispora]|nr:hypothetical protein BD560DRAFT_414660 [Blakeslea trispora]
MAEEVFEVERIVSHVFEKKRNKTHILYQIKWLNYDDADNTWEKEANVFATDLVINYWESLPKESPDRRLFEQIQALKKNPILLPSSIASTTQATSGSANHTVQESPKEKSKETVQKEPLPKPSSVSQETLKQQTLTHLYKPVSSETTQTTTNEPKSTPVPKRMPIVVVNEDDEDDDDEEEALRIRREAENKLSSNRATPVQEDVDMDSDHKRNDQHKRKKLASYHSDYFLEQHELKKKKKAQSEDDASVRSATNGSRGNLNEVIFDEDYGINPPMDWDLLAEKAIYVGREMKGAPLYCTVLWKDGVKSVHPVDQIRVKRPDLLIDYFLRQIDKN